MELMELADLPGIRMDLGLFVGHEMEEGGAPIHAWRA